MSKILFTGSTGLVGSRVCELLRNNHEITTISRDIGNADIQSDLNDLSHLKKTLENLDFENIFHFAGFTAVDEAENQKGDIEGQCYQTNVNMTQNILNIAASYNAKVFFISTDFVFNGENGPYSETDPTGSSDDLSWYGWTKKLAEDNILNDSEKHQIIRIAYPFRSNFTKGDFARDIISKMENKSLYPLFYDQFLTPTFIDNLADFINLSLERSLSGVYHLANSDLVTPYSFGQIINDVFEFNYPIEKGSIHSFRQNFPNKAKRPVKGGLVTKKVESLGVPVLTNEEAIKILKTQINSKSAKIS